MTYSSHGNRAEPSYVATSAVTYVPSGGQRAALACIVAVAAVTIFLVGYHFGAQPQAVAQCQALHSAETCSLVLR